MSIFINLSRQNLLKCSILHPAHLRCLSGSTTTYELFGKSNQEKLFKNKTTKLEPKTQNSMCTSTYIAEREEFLSSFPDIVQELKEKISLYNTDAAEHFEHVLQYNVPGHETFRRISTVHAFKLIAPKAALTEENIKLSIYLEWCFQLLEGMFNIVDDMMDGRITRLGKSCWYKLPDVETTAANDGILIESGVYRILKDHFRHLDCYKQLINHFHDFVLIGGLGQYIDSKTMRKNVLTFTMKQYKAVAEYKACYVFYNPIVAVLDLAGYTNPEIFSKAKAILFELGYFAQVQNDFIDCFGDPKLGGKIGAHIQEGKCTWLVVMCLQKATDAQKEVLRECYGKNDPECIRRVKQLYEELSLPNLYAAFEEDTYNNIKMLVETTAESNGVPAKVYLEIMRKLFRRET